MKNMARAVKTFRLLPLRLIVLVSVVLTGFLPSLSGVTAALAAPEAIKVIRVSSTGSDTGGCGTENNPCKSIQYATNMASSGDTILVAGGTYPYTASADNCSFLSTHAVVCILDKNITILGGYSTSNWNNPDPQANPTYIEGGNAKRGVAIIAYQSTASLHMENFTIQNGFVQGVSVDDFAYGAGIWAQNGSVNLKNVIFNQNRVVGGPGGASGGAGGGGALMVQSSRNGAASTLENVTFTSNSAKGGTGSQRGGVAIGGAMFFYQAAVSGNYLTFTNNLAQGGNSSGSGVDSSGMRADSLGGAVGLQDGSTATFTHVTAQNNQAIGGNAGNVSGSVGGGGFGGAFESEQSLLSIYDATVQNSTAKGGLGASGGIAFGGGIMTDSTNANFERSVITGNAAISGASLNGGNAGDTGGGGLYLTDFWSYSGVVINIANSVIADNRIDKGTPGNIRGGMGGGIVVQAVTVNINHCTIANNNFGSGFRFGQAIVVIGLAGVGGIPATANINYSIIANHIKSNAATESALTVIQGHAAYLNRGIFSNNTVDTNANNIPIAPGTISGLSTMLSASTVDFVATGGSNNDYHLQSASPAIDKASGSSVPVDADGNARPVNYISDIGAYEYNKPALRTSPQTVIQLADASTHTERSVSVNVTTGPAVQWTASTAADWLYLGPTGTSHTTTGQSGSELVLRCDQSLVDLGEHLATVTISANGMDDITFQIDLVKVDEIQMVNLPMIVH